MMGEINKTDKLDVRGLTQLQRTGTLPTVWIPPGELRDQRDLPRTRMVLVRQRTQLKNRIHSTLAKYALHDIEVSDLFGARGRALVRQRLELLPPCTAYTTRPLLEQVERLDHQVREFEHQIRTLFKPTPTIQHLLTLPGVGLTLAVVIALEVGDVARLPTAEKLAASTRLRACTGWIATTISHLRSGAPRRADSRCDPTTTRELSGPPCFGAHPFRARGSRSSVEFGVRIEQSPDHPLVLRVVPTRLVFEELDAPLAQCDRHLDSFVPKDQVLGARKKVRNDLQPSERFVRVLNVLAHKFPCLCASTRPRRSG
jgi:hypothetical protein